jgi:hypothetical protein
MSLAVNSPEFNNEVEVLVQRFPSLEESVLREILEKNNGHSGKTTRQIFKEYSEDPVVEESKREFEMKFLKPNIWSYTTSCSGGRESPGGRENPRSITVNMNINYDNNWGRQNHMLVVDDWELGISSVLCDTGGVFMSIEEEETKYPNLDYFSDLVLHNGINKDKHWWGSDSKVTYTSDYPDSNVKNLVPTVHEIIALVDDYKFQILGKIPYKLDDGGMGLYVGHSVNGKTKKRLPEGWSIGVSDEYYGLRYYNDGEKTHWKHPLE